MQNKSSVDRSIALITVLIAIVRSIPVVVVFLPRFLLSLLLPRVLFYSSMHSIESLLLYDVRYRYDNVSASSSLLGWDWYLELSLLHRCRWDGIGIWNCLCYITIAGIGNMRPFYMPLHDCHIGNCIICEGSCGWWMQCLFVCVCNLWWRVQPLLDACGLFWWGLLFARQDCFRRSRCIGGDHAGCWLLLIKLCVSTCEAVPRPQTTESKGIIEDMYSQKFN